MRITLDGFVICRYLSGVCKNALRLSSFTKRYVLELYESVKSGLPGTRTFLSNNATGS